MNLQLLVRINNQNNNILSKSVLKINIICAITAYNALRNKIMESERNSGLGGNVWLSSAEEKANSILMNAKREEVPTKSIFINNFLFLFN